MGLNTYKVPMSMFATSRASLTAALAEDGKTKGVVLLQGGDATSR